MELWAVCWEPPLCNKYLLSELGLGQGSRMDSSVPRWGGWGLLCQRQERSFVLSAFSPLTCSVALQVQDDIWRGCSAFRGSSLNLAIKVFCLGFFFAAHMLYLHILSTSSLVTFQGTPGCRAGFLAELLFSSFFNSSGQYQLSYAPPDKSRSQKHSSIPKF